MNKPKLCGSNNIYIPSSGCSDCSELEWEVNEINSWIAEFEEEGYNSLANKPTINGVTVEGDKDSEDYLIASLSEEEITALTPMECYIPPCQDSHACYGEVCCALVGCASSEDSEIVDSES